MPDDPCLQKLESSDKYIFGVLVAFNIVFIVLTCIILITAPNELEKSKETSVQKNSVKEETVTDMNEGRDGYFLRTFKIRNGEYVIIFIPEHSKH